MAGKSNLTATLFSQKKLLGRAHTSNLKSDAQEAIPSNIQVSSQTIFGETIPENPAQSLYVLQGASNNQPATVEYVDFIVEPIGGTSYDANTGSFGDVGFGGGDEDTSAGTHGYRLVLPSDYETLSTNAKRGNGYFDNDNVVYETLGRVQLVPPNFSNHPANPYFLKIYRGDPSDPTNEITSLDETDWQVDYYSGIVFLQDYRADRVPTYARGFLYVGKMTGDLTDGTGGGGTSINMNNVADNRILTAVDGNTINGEANLTFDGNTLEMNSTTGGIVLPRMTNEQRNQIAAVDGTMIYNTSYNAFQFFQNGAWATLGTVGNGGGGSDDPTTLPGFGSGILALNDDGDGAARNLLIEYAQEPQKYAGRTIYLANTEANPVFPFDRPGKFYFNEGGVWHASPFYSPDAVAQPILDSFPDMQDILSLDGFEIEDRTLLTSFYENPESYVGRAIYLSNTGSVAIGEFDQEDKYYYNEGGVWFPSSLHADAEDDDDDE